MSVHPILQHGEVYVFSSVDSQCVGVKLLSHHHFLCQCFRIGDNEISLPVANLAEHVGAHNLA